MKVRFLLISLLAGLGMVAASCSKTDPTPDPKPDPKIDNIIIAHRGACKEFNLPDNSLAALKRSIDLGLYASECDINITSDGKVIVIHGESFGGKPVLGNTYETLKNAGTLSNGEKLPLLEDFLKAVLNGKGTKLMLDIKSLSESAGGNAQSIKAGVAAAKLIKEMKAEKRVMFIIGRLDVFKGVIDEVGSAWDVAYMNHDLTPQKFLSNTGGKTNWGNFDISAFGKNPDTGKFDAAYCEEKYKLWTKAGVRLSFYTIDTDDQINWYLSHKDNVVACTNYPVKLLKAVK